MRILLLCTDAFGGHGGIALYNRDLAEALASDPECEEVVVIPRIVPHDPGPIPAKVRFIAKAARSNASYLRAMYEARQDRFDLVVCGHVNLLPVACLVARNPLLLIYGIEAWKPIRSPLSRRLLHRCRGVISISAVTRDRFLGWSGYAGPTWLLPNAIHLDEYGIRPRRPDLIARYGLEGKRVLLTVGRLASAERYKGFDEVMEILPRLPDDVVYLIAGTGDDRPRLEAKARDLGVADRVVFTGFFADDQKADLYALADVYVMPSRGEGFGFVLLEAMACGVPVIGSALDGGAEALRGGELGTLVRTGVATELDLAIREALNRTDREPPPGLDHFSFDRFTSRAHRLLAASGTPVPLFTPDE